MSKINREDMLELTRRMTVKRNCFSRIAGAYLDEEGYVDGTFNTHFLKLSLSDQVKNLATAKAIPFADTNVNLKEYSFVAGGEKPASIRQLLRALKECELKNDALLDIFYEIVAENYHSKEPYAVYVFYGSYDVPAKAGDKMLLGESEEVYQFLICAICPVYGDYEVGNPKCGFLYPAFKERSADEDRIDIFNADAAKEQQMSWIIE